MPYITQDRRKAIEEGAPAITAGELNYAITKLIVRFQNLHGLSYDTANQAIGALTAARDEYYRRVVAPYEDQKRAMNGDVYTFEPEEV